MHGQFGLLLAVAIVRHYPAFFNYLFCVCSIFFYKWQMHAHKFGYVPYTQRHYEYDQFQNIRTCLHYHWWCPFLQPLLKVQFKIGRHCKVIIVCHYCLFLVKCSWLPWLGLEVLSDHYCLFLVKRFWLHWMGVSLLHVPCEVFFDCLG